ncbi:hypothetical protein GCM10009678_31850 [Actinomadura kijaniata]|uniref:Uncharacterized protein n=1 Tax=Actinomadura namibiensis TaxID=182080 RepID=A0A7W3QIP9_ACTNM|nr:hypothetical protein [Actinomadura namibiensis]MBA8948674.1 hypothetical protein [Actinomadura namibiensis]
MSGENTARTEVRIVGAERPDGLELRTLGLAVRGLPELRVTGLPPYLGQGWARVLGLVAQRLAASGRRAPTELELAEDVTVLLAVDKNGVAVLPPLGFRGPVNDWRRDLLVRLFPEASP